MHCYTSFFVNKMLRLPSDYILENGTYVFAVPTLTLAENTLKVHMDGVKPSETGLGLEQLLASFHPKPLQVHQYHSFFPRSYISLEKNYFDCLKIYITNDQNESVSFASEPLRCQLHFRIKNAQGDL